MSQSEMFPLEAEETLIDSAEATVSPEGEVTPEDITEPEPADELHALLGTTPAKRVAAAPEVVVEPEVAAEPEVAVELEVEVAVESVQVAEPVAEKAGSEFGALGLNKSLVSALDAAGYTTPTPIQAETIPLVLSGRDVLGQAQTGTGKTAAFALPLLQRIKLSEKQTQVLVLVPTRELAIQVAKSFEKYSATIRGLRVVPIYGGQDYQIQFRELNRGAQIVVGTPGRVMDHMRRGSLKLDELQCLVLDEADEMLRMGFAEDVDWVLTQSPESRQMALFSATMPGPIREIAKKHLKNPAQITIKQKTATADTINQRYYVAAPHQKQAALARILEAEPIDAVLIFVKMRSTTEPLADFLAQSGLKTAALNGDIAQKQRERIVERLRAGKIDVIVATDVAARGLDVQRISHVINYDLPHDSEAYVHRIGRTGRAGRSGEAILFVHPRDRYQLKQLESATRHTIEPMELPSNRDINKQRVAGFHEKITEGLSHKDLDTFKSIVSQYQRQNEDVTLETIAASLAVLANKETPLLVTETLKQTSFAADSGRGSNDRYGSKNRGNGNRGNAKREHGSRNQGNGKHEFNSDGGSSSYRNDEGLETYRIEVGRSHQVLPGNIVGAIANEAGIGNGKIGKIKIFERFSTVDLPKDLSHDLITVIGNVSVAGQKLRISRMGDSRPQEKAPSQSGDSHPKTGARFQNSNRGLNRSSFKKKSGGNSAGVKSAKFKGSRRKKGSTEA
jgi:ATP-dependent RNA helicase DeaD